MKAIIGEEVRKKTTVGRPLYTGPFQTHGIAELDRECKRIPRRAVGGGRAKECTVRLLGQSKLTVCTCVNQTQFKHEAGKFPEDALEKKQL